MVDQSELAFRMLCRRHGATAAYTPMLHSRLFLEDPNYRAEHFSTCEGDRPLMVQFCANDPETLLAAARIVEPHADAIDLNLGCPQRIARRGRYGAFLMDDLPLVERIVRTCSEGLSVPVTVKIRIFPDLERTVEYARMLERAGASLIAVHGRLREQKKSQGPDADWDAIKAVVEAVSVPVLANGNIRTLEDVQRCMEYTGAVGVLSAESLLEDPALFSPRPRLPGGAHGAQLLLEYLDLVDLYPCPMRMVTGHAFRMLGAWLSEFTDLRDRLNQQHKSFGVEDIREIAREVVCRIEGLGRDYPVPRLSERALARMEREAAMAAAIAEQNREESCLQRIAANKAESLGQVEPQRALQAAA
ncbi:g134 [Coccomyxa elongata]